MIELQSLTILCGMASVLFASIASQSRLTQALWLSGLFIGGVFSAWPGSVFYGTVLASEQLSLCLALLASLLWLWPRFAPPIIALGTLLASQWIALLMSYGTPSIAALPGWLLLSGVSFWLSKKRAVFNNVRLRDESTLMIALLGLASVIIPTFIEQWQNAQQLLNTQHSLSTHKQNTQSAQTADIWAEPVALTMIIGLPLLAGWLFQRLKDKKR